MTAPRMKTKLVLCAVLVGVVALVPTASATQDRSRTVQRARTSQVSAGGVGTALAAELAKQGVHAAIAQWAPELQKYSSPVEAGLAQVQAQLTEIHNKLNQLIAHQNALGDKLSCQIHKNTLAHALAQAQTWFNTVVAADAGDLLSLYQQHWHDMATDQLLIHNELVGGLLHACAKHIQNGFDPFISADLADEVHDFYAVYHLAAFQLLFVRSNMVALYRKSNSEEVQRFAKEVEQYWTVEEARIKPHFPNTMVYDTQTGWLWRTHVVHHGETGLRQTLRNEGWHVTGYTYVPECGAVEAEFKKSGESGLAALTYFRKYHMLPTPDKIVCYDTHNQLFEFSLHSYTYNYAGEVQSFAPSLVAKPNNGQITIEHFTY